MILFYLLKVTACTILFFGFYVLVLQKLTFFKINRFYLLVTLLLSFVIPALQFEIKHEVVTLDTDPVANLSEVKMAEKPSQLIQSLAVEHQPETKPEIDWLSLVPFAYGAITLVLLLICIWRLFGLIKYTGNYTESDEGLKLINKTAGFTNCSFFNYVFIDGDKLGDADLAVLLKHELVHARQYHSIDKIILMVFKSVLWFNPIVYLYDKALEQVHEYEADEFTSAAYGSEAYASLLLKLAIAKSDMPLIHNFVKSPIKARIKMLFSSKSPDKKKNAYLLMLPMVLMLLWVFAVKSVYAVRQIRVENTSQKGLAETGQSLLNDNGTIEKHLMAGSVKNIKKRNVVPGNQGAVEFHGFKNSKESARPVKPRIISFTKITGDIKEKVSFMENAVIDIVDCRLNAKYVQLDEPNHKMIAKNAVLKTKDGNSLTASVIVFDLKNGNFNATPDNGKAADPKKPGLERQLKNALLAQPVNETDAKVEYRAKDSVKMSKDKSIVYLFGDAMVIYNGIKLNGSKITYNKTNNTFLANGATVSSNKIDGLIKADSIYLDLKTSKATLFGENF
ncbi:M56 family metallopeptidase [Pedobacter suwonensis]|uniref:M56 family metallopeptidase n=1 Tax=Pedobacter suwonensis TaxID=332999 RepID=UPI0025F6F6FC|nr:M56 family metallopeptidase [uncultured Pedobacter sp.]